MEKLTNTTPQTVNIQVETGLKEYRFNDKVSVFFNPTDSNFINRIYDCFSNLSEKEDQYREQLQNAETYEILKLSKQLDAEMRETLEVIFGVDVITPLIGNTNSYSMAGGMPIWANILLTVMEQLEVEATEQQKLNTERVKYYTQKYQVKDHRRKTK